MYHNDIAITIYGLFGGHVGTCLGGLVLWVGGMYGYGFNKKIYSTAF